MFPLVSEAVGKVIDVAALRWISFGHVESDECGSMNQWLAAAPQRRGGVQPARLHGVAQRPGRPPAAAWSPTRPPTTSAATGSGAIPTPHVPHGWEAQVLFDETTRTLFCGDLFTQIGDGPAIVHDVDLIGPALAAEDMFGATSLTAATAPTMRRLAELEPRTLALMHGPAFAGDCRQALLDLADAYEARFTASIPQAVA